MPLRKIINDPVYGFITIDDELIYEVISHPYYQRLRRISQMAMAYLVYPGATHSRLHHSLGAYHLMGNAINELRSKGTIITKEEEQAAKIAILLHDIGHGPFSHALEFTLVKKIHHEDISLLLIEHLNKEFNHKLDLALSIFKNKYPKKFLHQLVSGQLDVDRMDYLSRDSYFSGVSEGAIGYDRILKMLVVHKGELMIEEKGIYSIEKFLVARRLMYGQVYLHKTVLCAEQMLIKIIERAREIKAQSQSTALNIFLTLHNPTKTDFKKYLNEFCTLDDVDIISALKVWSNHTDKALSNLCTMLINRKLLKIKYEPKTIAKNIYDQYLQKAAQKLRLGKDDVKWFVFTGEAVSSTYNFNYEKINILFKDGTVKDITEVDNALIHQNLKGKIKKYYICYIG